MINILSQAGQIDYNTKEFVLDTKDDLEELRYGAQGLSSDPGSTAFIIETSEVYMKNGQGEWKLI